ncbi:MAG: hypothetical protein NC131_20470 [Roseburia sp.]|nr:hypothetical protein [Roseburia sp.]
MADKPTNNSTAKPVAKPSATAKPANTNNTAAAAKPAVKTASAAKPTAARPAPKTCPWATRGWLNIRNSALFSARRTRKLVPTFTTKT